jgi:uncharacterized membrane protein YvbJ
VNEEKCAQCGTPAIPGAKFCESCGAPLTAASQPVQGAAVAAPPIMDEHDDLKSLILEIKQKNDRIMQLLIVVIVILVILLIFVFVP